MRRTLWIWAFLPALVAATPAFAQSAADHDCFLQETPACQADRIRQQQILYGLPPIEELVAAGAQVRRAFYVEGALRVGDAGPDLGALSFVRMPGQAPTVWFHSSRAGGRNDAPLTAELPEAVWREVLERSADLDRASGWTGGICIHVWEYVVEAADPAIEGRPASLRRRYDTGCSEPSSTVAYANRLGTLAAGLFPACAGLPPADTYQDPVLRLRACGRLGGNRLTAAQVSRELGRLRAAGPDLDAAFAEHAVLDWGGARIAGHDAIVARWRRALRQQPHILMNWDRIEGVAVDRVETSGILFYSLDAPHGSRIARIELVWMRGGDGRFTVTHAVVGRFTSGDNYR
jgi:hypothetical protein